MKDNSSRVGLKGYDTKSDVLNSAWFYSSHKGGPRWGEGSLVVCHYYYLNPLGLVGMELSP